MLPAAAGAAGIPLPAAAARPERRGRVRSQARHQHHSASKQSSPPARATPKSAMAAHKCTAAPQLPCYRVRRGSSPGRGARELAVARCQENQPQHSSPVEDQGTQERPRPCPHSVPLSHGQKTPLPSADDNVPPCSPPATTSALPAPDPEPGSPPPPATARQPAAMLQDAPGQVSPLVQRWTPEARRTRTAC